MLSLPSIAPARVWAITRVVSLAAGLSLASPVVLAQAFDAVRLYGAAGQDGGTVGAAFIGSNAYPGSNRRRNLILPLLDYQWSNGWFAGTSNGLGHDFAQRSDLQYGLRLTLDRGRKANLAADLNGMGDIDLKPEAGAFLNYFPAPQWFLTSSLRYGSGNNSKGLVVDLGAGHASQLAPQWRMALGAAVTLANADYLQNYFGVTPAQAAASGHVVYAPGAGSRDARVNAALTYFLSRQVTFSGALSVSTLLGSAKDSPLARKTHVPTGVFAISYAF